MSRPSHNHDSKEKSLRQVGAFNLCANAVSDPLFAESEFFDSQDLVQVKYELLRRVRHDGESVTKAVAAFGFSRPTFYEAKRAFEQGGLAGLVPRKRGPRGAHKLNDEIMDFVETCLSNSLQYSMTQLATTVQERFGVKVHPRSIKRALRRRGKKTP